MASDNTKSRSRDRRELHPVAGLRARRETRRKLTGELLSIASLAGRPVCDSSGAKVGRVADIEVRWSDGVAYPPVTAVVVAAGRGKAVVAASDAEISESEVRLRSGRISVEKAVRRKGDVALATDVLDHQLLDVVGVQVVRANDVFLMKRGDGWALGGIDIGMRSLLRRLVSPRLIAAVPSRMIPWSDVQAFAQPANGGPATADSPTAAAGDAGGGVRLAKSSSALRSLGSEDLAGILDHLGRPERTQFVQLAGDSTVAGALARLDEGEREALLRTLDERDRARLSALLPRDERQ
jgi:sporulation protein YlmC with PRC-barrel domain